MRTLAKTALLAVLLAPALASAQVSLGARLGYGLPLGQAAEDIDLGDLVKGQIPIQLDLGYRATPALTVGGFFAYGFGFAGDDTLGMGDVCDLDGVDCSTRVYRVGVQVDYRFARPSATPWVGLGVGYEWASLEVEGPGGEVKLSVKGFELLNLQGGVEWKVARNLSVGPFAMLSIGRYSSAEVDGADEDIDDKAFHEWLQVGVRGRFDL